MNSMPIICKEQSTFEYCQSNCANLICAILYKNTISLSLAHFSLIMFDDYKKKKLNKQTKFAKLVIRKL